MRRAMVLLLLALGWVAFGPASPAFACDQPLLPFDRQVSNAAHIFTGTVTEVRSDPSQAGARRIYEVRVEQELKGTGLDPAVRIAAPARTADCGLGSVARGDVLAFFVGGRVAGVYYEAVSNEGTTATSPELEQRIAAELAPEPDPEPVEVELTQVDDGEPIGIVRAIAPGVIIAMLGLVALVVGRLFGRPKH